MGRASPALPRGGRERRRLRADPPAEPVARRAGARPRSSRPTCASRRRPDRVVGFARRAVRAARRPREQRGRLARRRRGHGVAALLGGHHRAEPARAARTLAARERRHAGQADGGVIVNIASVSGTAAIAGHRRVRRGEGGAAEPDAVARGGVGAEGARERRDAGARAHRAVALALRGRRRGRGGRARRCRWGAWRSRGTWPRRASSWRRRWRGT